MHCILTSFKSQGKTITDIQRALRMVLYILHDLLKVWANCFFFQLTFSAVQTTIGGQPWQPSQSFVKQITKEKVFLLSHLTDFLHCGLLEFLRTSVMGANFGGLLTPVSTVQVRMMESIDAHCSADVWLAYDAIWHDPIAKMKREFFHGVHGNMVMVITGKLQSTTPCR